MIKKRIIPTLALAATMLLFLFFYSSRVERKIWEGLPQHIGLGEQGGDSPSSDDLGSGGISTDEQLDPGYASWKPRHSFKPGSPMPAGHNYTSVLVVAKTKDEDSSWMDREIPDQERAVYIADDPTAPLHPPTNKGHEVMVYLSWIIDNYANLPDVTIFMHAHQYTWHNDNMLDSDAANLVKRLSRPHVWREGFVNMRCSWYPGCPDWMHPGVTEENVSKQEEVHLAKSWSELFPLDKLPPVLAQPCCGQFALSRERIQAQPHVQYVSYREWLFSTELPDFLSGRIWEYVWQFVFTGENIYCPQEHRCFCEQFGICFGSEENYNDFVALRNELSAREADLREWNDKKKAIEEAKEDGRLDEVKQLKKPESGQDREFLKEIERLRPVVDRLKQEATERGKHSRKRTSEAGRE
jgi:hypothetical protein